MKILKKVQRSKKPFVGALWLAALALIVGLAALGWMISSQDSDSKQMAAATLAQAVDHYRDGESASAMNLFELHGKHWIELPEGCELSISLLANDPSRLAELESIAVKCLRARKAIGISSEALAMSLSERGRGQEAITRIKALTNGVAVDRTFGALANLQLTEKAFEAAGQELLAAMRASDIWSVWLSKGLRIPQIANDQAFLSSAVHIVIKKKKSVESVESRLVEQLRKNTLNNLASLLIQHREKAASPASDT